MAAPSCIGCHDPYDVLDRAPMLLSGCGHALCLRCIVNLRSQPPSNHQCPTCRQSVDLAHITPNVALQETLGATSASVLGAGGGASEGKSNGVGTNHLCSIHGKELLLWCLDHSYLGCGMCFREPPHKECDRYMLDQARVNLEKTLTGLVDDMRDCGKRLKSLREHVEVRSEGLSDKRERLKREITEYFDEYIGEVLKRRDQLLGQANTNWDSLQTGLDFQLGYAQQGLEYLGERYEEVRTLRQMDTFAYLQSCPELLTSLKAAVKEARQSLPKLEADLSTQMQDPAFSAPSQASNRHALLAVKVQVDPSATGMPSQTQMSIDLPLSNGPGVGVIQPQSKAAQHASPSLPPMLAPLSLNSPLGGGLYTDSPSSAGGGFGASPVIGPSTQYAPGPAVSAQPPQQQQPQQQVSHAPSQHPISWAMAAAAKPHGTGAGATTNATAVANASARPPVSNANGSIVSAAKNSPAKQPSSSHSSSNGPKSSNKPGEPKSKLLQQLQKRYPGVPVCELEQPEEVEAVIDNVSNEGNDGFFHFLSPDGVCQAVYYNFVGKVGTDNPDFIEPATIKKGQRYMVELKENPYSHLVLQKPERRWVAASIRRLSGGASHQHLHRTSHR